MKKTLVLLAAIVLVVGMLPVAALAQGHCSSHSSSQKHRVCNVSKCNKTESHKHNRTTYVGHYLGDGHKYHKVCGVKSCKKPGAHKHGGATYLPHTKTDGHRYHH